MPLIDEIDIIIRSLSNVKYEEYTRVNNLKKIFNLNRQPVIHTWRLFDHSSKDGARPSHIHIIKLTYR
jgi:hypothetical protein